ncbi:unnamed protein product [Citrullus colocynthis]|uniref:Uncharacterized protein n=1 Tax=Citrullus colocynthis TaxID=252529 RepID=A0ABP0Z1R0_9ROSI
MIEASKINVKPSDLEAPMATEKQGKKTERDKERSRELKKERKDNEGDLIAVVVIHHFSISHPPPSSSSSFTQQFSLLLLDLGRCRCQNPSPPPRISLLLGLLPRNS